ncbi:MAG: 3-oxoacyl-ACP reductase FabG [Rhodospirillales bacterium]|nr:3-oxoacyl-ACP reductase FabG [Rhodospirillales bacterium]
MRLDGKVAVIVGASRGVGVSLCREFAAAGARVLFCARSVEKIKKLEDELSAQGFDVCAVKADVSRPDDCRKLIETAVERFGRLDILVNNAGFTRPAMMIKMTEDQWDQVVDIHLKGAFLCAQAAGLHMKEQKSGKIINVTSVAGIVGTVGQINYSAAKGGIISMTKSIARELARYNVCANVISLGIVATDMTEKIRSDEKLKEIYMNRILLKRFAEADDIAPAFVFLASDESNYITGQLLCVDGGYGMI